MEERKKVKRQRVTRLNTGVYTQPTMAEIRKVNIPDEDKIMSLGISPHKEKVWDDEGGETWTDYWTLITEYLGDETDEEVIKRMNLEEKTAREKELKEQKEKDTEYLTYLRLKAKYDTPEGYTPST